MAFGQDFLQAFFGNDYLKDYRHASKTFRTNGYENSPRLKFLFHVYFNINTTGIPQLGTIFDAGSTATIGILVKNIELPRYKIDVETMNQYNRKRLVQRKIEYQPIKIAMHDDGGDLVRQLWYNYFAYYYKDPSQAYRGQVATNGSMGQNSALQNGFGYNTRDIYSGARAVNDWGYIGESYNDGTASAGGKPAFFNDISIYGFNQHKFVQYVLINPLISEWSHDAYDYGEDDGVMENTLTISYETVKYYTGAIGAGRSATNVAGFADPAHYDTEPSPLGRPGGTQSVLGQGGLLDAGIGIYEDLQSGSVAGVIGAVQTAGRTYGTFKGKDLQAIVREEAVQAATDVLRNDIPGAVRAQPNGRGSSIQEQLQAPQFPRPPLTNQGS